MQDSPSHYADSMAKSNRGGSAKSPGWAAAGFEEHQESWMAGAEGEENELKEAASVLHEGPCGPEGRSGVHPKGDGKLLESQEQGRQDLINALQGSLLAAAWKGNKKHLESAFMCVTLGLWFSC